MNKNNPKTQRQRRVRGKIESTEGMPRLSVHRSNKAIYAQLIDDEKGMTLLGLSEKHAKGLSGNKLEKAKALGLALAAAAKEKKITKAIFDRGSYKYHGRVKALAEGARAGGLQF